MNVTCPNCATIYRVDPAKVPEAGRSGAMQCVQRGVRRPPGGGAGTSPAPAGGTRRRQPVPAPTGRGGPGHPLRRAQPACSLGHQQDLHADRRPAGRSQQRPLCACQRPPLRRGRSLSPDGPCRLVAAPGGGAPRARPCRRPLRAVCAARPGCHAGSRGRTAVAAARSRPQRLRPRPLCASSPPGERGPAGARPANPFLSQDPALKARRLARALISDMVVYHPGKRQEGLRDGNLKELFEEEIKKSWEEYAEQVGREVAESTAYFREALNEILAGGRQMF